MNRNQIFGIFILAFILLFMVGLYFYFENNPEGNKPSSALYHSPTHSAKVQKGSLHETDGVLHRELMPEFPGGQDAMDEFLSENLTYPVMAKEQGIQGKVWIGFIVEPDGKVTNVEILRGIGGGCDEEAKRVVEKMPPWKPGLQDGKPVKVKFRFPINFTLN